MHRSKGPSARAVLSFAIASCAAPTFARAQAAPPTQAGEVRADSAHRAQSDREINQVASMHFRLGMQQFRDHHDADAAREFQLVYDLTGQTEMLYNIARAHEAAGNFAAAIAALETFLARGAPSLGEDQVRDAIAVLRARQAGTPATASPPVAAGCPDPATRPSAGSTPASPLLQLRIVRVEYRRTPVAEYGPIVVLGAGLIVGGFGAWQIIAGSDDRALYEQANRGDITWGRDVQAAYRAAPREMIAGYVLVGAGGALVLAGLGWFAFRGRGERRSITEASAGPLPNGGIAVSLGGRF